MRAAEHFSGGLPDPVFDSQAIFRAALGAFARPGRLGALVADADPPPPLLAAAGAIVLALVDGDTPVFLDATLAAKTSVGAWIGFHTGAPIVANPLLAAFAVVASPAHMLPLERFATGTDEYPDRSTTVIVQVPESLAPNREIRIAGPGIRGVETLTVPGMPDDFEAAWAANRGRFPQGVDILFARADGIVGLPRTSRIVAAAD